MLTNKPLLTITLSATDKSPGETYRLQPYGTKKKPLSQRARRQPYRKASIRLRGVGNKYQTSIKLEVWGKPKEGKSWSSVQMKTDAGRLMASDLFG